MATIELRELLPVETPLGSGYAFLVDSNEHDNYWTVILNNRAIVTFPQADILAGRDYTRGRGLKDAEMRGILRRATKLRKQA